MSRTMTAAVGAVALAAALGVASPAQAGDDRRPATGQARFQLAGEPPPPPTTFAGPSRRTVHSAVVRLGSGLFLRGDVERYSRGVVVVQRQRCQTCSWERHEVLRTGKGGRFRSEIGAPRRGSAFWRAKVPASDGYARSFSATWETYY